jgi:hypothetical protein
MFWSVTPQPHASVCRARARRAACALAVGISVFLVAPVAASADTIVGSTLSTAPTVTKEATADSVYWMQTLADGSSAAMPVAASVKSITVRGYWTGAGMPQIAFQVLRPQPDGSLLVVATSQLWPLSKEPGTYTFTPAGMTVQPEDFIGLATIGGNFVIGASVAGASTNDFTGHNQDMNGDFIRPTKVESNVELDLQVDLVPTASIVEKPPPPPKEEKPPPPKPCKCQQISVKLDGTLLKKRRLGANQRAFGVGFDWRMTCTEGKGGCAATLRFSPPAIRAGTLPRKGNLKLNLTTLNFVCKTACKTSTSGRFEIKMRSRTQLTELFGRTFAFTIYTSCGGATFRYQVKVFVDRAGHMHPAPSRPLHRH